jgi:hypothetical protein
VAVNSKGTKDIQNEIIIKKLSQDNDQRFGNHPG